jgi:rSAM/selenodomain-associated transferase 2
MKISIIVPVLNEAGLIRKCLAELRKAAPQAEILIVDGNSSDETVDYAAPLCHRVLQTTAGRARQMNAGARVAGGDVFWFVHADATVPAGAISEIEQALRDERVVGGFFRIRIPRANFIYRFTDCFAHYAGLLFGIRYGDHGLFCRHESFEMIGGFPEVPLMEDADFFRKLRRTGRVVVIQDAIIVSPRRYERIGPARLTAVFALMSLLYFFRAPRRLLDWIYQSVSGEAPGNGKKRSNKIVDRSV